MGLSVIQMLAYYILVRAFLGIKLKLFWFSSDRYIIVVGNRRVLIEYTNGRLSAIKMIKNANVINLLSG